MKKYSEMGKILLEGMKFFARHGFYSEEQKIGANFIVDLELQTEFSEAASKDEISGTVNYEEVYQVVKEEMGNTVQLLEHAASNILSRVKREFPSISTLKITLSKLNPPIEGEVEKVSVVMEK